MTVEEMLETEALLIADGLNDCIVGLAFRAGSGPVVCYDMEKVVLKFMGDGMTREDAEEYCEFNVFGAYVGEGTPVFLEIAE